MRLSGTRSLVPANSFAEYAPEPNPETKKKDVVWLALNDDRPLMAFAGIWTEFKGGRGTKSKPVPGPHLVYGFLTTRPNAVVEPIHPKAMPVILTTDEELTSGCARHGMRRGRCKGRCRVTRSRSSPGVPTRKIKRLRDADPCLLSPTSALQRISASRTQVGHRVWSEMCCRTGDIGAGLNLA